MDSTSGGPYTPYIVSERVVMDNLGSALIGGLLSGSVIAAVLGVLTRKRLLTLESEIEDRFRKAVEARQSQWALLSEVLGPVCAHLRRTNMAFARWRELNLFLEQQIIAESNAEIRRILLQKYHLLTPDLRSPAMALIEHYDMWFEEFERQRRSQKPSAGTAAFVFAGPQGYPFPRSAEQMFEEALTLVHSKLLGADSLRSISDAAHG